MKPVKVFGIGFHKTGTSSLEEALKILGYTVCGPIGIDDPQIAEHAVELALTTAERFDAVQDNPWPIVYRELDARFPGSRFILTHRPAASWLKSAVTHFGTTDTHMRTWIYGVGHPVGHEQVYLDRYNRHNDEVRAYFKDRPGDLLDIDVTKDGAWDGLCTFLGAPVPKVPFPHANSAAARIAYEARKNAPPRTLLQRVADRIKNAGSGR
jgi:hypothetical protein